MLNLALQHPIYGTIVAGLLLFSGGIASVYSTELKESWPLAWHARGPICEPAAWTWTVSLISIALFLFRERSIAQAEAAAQRELVNRSERLEELIRTLPPSNFLAAFAKLYGACDDVMTAAIGDPEPPFHRPTVEASARQILGKIAVLAKIFDGDRPDVRYAANVMMFVRSEEVPANDRPDYLTRLKFCPDGVTLDGLAGFLDLRLELSAVSGDETAGKDPTLLPLALPIPKIFKTEAGKSLVLPGAPQAFASGEPDILLDLERLDGWFQSEGDFTAEVKERLIGYLRTRNETVQSFVSIPLFQRDSLAEEGTTFAVLNVQCDRPGMLKQSPGAVEQFVAVTWPLQILLGKVLRSLADATDEPIEEDRETVTLN